VETRQVDQLWRSTADSQCLKVMSLTNRKNPAKTWHRTWHMDLVHQLIQLLFTEASLEMVFVEVGCQWSIQEENQWKGSVRKDWDMPNPSGTELKISGNMFYEVINPNLKPRPKHHSKGGGSSWQNLTKVSQHPKKTFGMSFKMLGKLFLKTTFRHHKRACLREFRLCWRIKGVIPSTDFQAC